MQMSESQRGQGRLLFKCGIRRQARSASPLRFTSYPGHLLDLVVQASVSQWLTLMQRQPDVIDPRAIKLRPQ